MKKLLLTILIIIGAFYLEADIVASVGDHKITYDQLWDTMQLFKDRYNLSLVNIRQLALDKLIDEQVLLSYAKERGISVDEDELDAYFIRELGNHSRFQTNGIFDYAKYREFKKTETGDKIIGEMKRDILVSKTETLIRNSLSVSDEILLQNFINDNIEIDLSYALVDVEKANVTADFTSEEAIDYFAANRKNYKTLPRVKFRFFIVFNEEFREDAETYYDHLNSMNDYTDQDSLEADPDSLRTAFIFREMQNNSRKKALEQLMLWKQDLMTDYTFIETPYLNQENQLGDLPREVIMTALELEKNEFSEPINIDSGYLILQLIDKQKPESAELSEVKDKVWQDYIEIKTNQLFADEFKRYFGNNIDDFIIPAAVVYKIEINKPKHFFSSQRDQYRETIKDLIMANANDEKNLENIIRDYRLKDYSNIIYLERFTNKDEVDQIIVSHLKNKQNSGFIETEDNTVFYKVNSYFPEYIPDYRDIEQDINDMIYINQLDTSTYQDYYDTHKSDFTTPDSLMLGGVFIRINADTLAVDPLKVNNFYQKNINSFYREYSVEFDYIYTEKYPYAQRIKYYLDRDVDIELLRLCFGEEYDLPRNTMINLKDLPSELQNTIKNLPVEGTSNILNLNSGYLVIRKLREFQAGLRKFSEVEQEIAYKFKYEEADSVAFYRAKTVFDSTRYYSQSKKFASEDELFKTSFLPADSEFEILGDIGEYRKDLLRIWTNEKLSNIVKLPEGYAVVYLLGRSYSRQLDYQESLPRIKEVLAARNRYKTAKEYINNLKEQIQNGDDPESLLFFLGGWHQAENLPVSSQIFGQEFSHLIFSDIIKRDNGYYSPVINLSEDKLLFYRIDRITRITQQEFAAQKDSYRDELIDKKYREWLAQYKTKLDIKIRI